MGIQNSAERHGKLDIDLTSESSTDAELIFDEDSRKKITPETNNETISGAPASSRNSTATAAASKSQQSRNGAKSTPQPPSISSEHQWPEDLCDNIAILMRETVAGGHNTEAKWDRVSFQLRERYGFERTASGIKNYWARKGRAKYDIDERRKPKPEKMVTSLQSPETRRVARKRHGEPAVAGRRHQNAVTAPINATNLSPSAYHYQQRPDLYIKVPDGSDPPLGPYGPTRNMNSSNGDQSESRPYGPTMSVNIDHSDQSGSQDSNSEGPDGAPRKRLDGDRLKLVDGAVVDHTTPVKANHKKVVKTKRTPKTPKKYSRELDSADKKAEDKKAVDKKAVDKKAVDKKALDKKAAEKKAAGSSLALFPGLVKYMGPSGISKDLDSKVPADGPQINAQVSQADEVVANLSTSPNSGKSRKAPGSIEVSTKSPAKVINQTNPVSGKVQKLQREDITKPKNSINTAAPDLASGSIEVSTKNPAKFIGQTSDISGKVQELQREDINKPKNAINTAASDLAPGSFQVSAKNPAKFISQTSHISGKVQKLQREDMTKPKNSINTAAPDLAPPRTPSSKAEAPKDDSSSTIDDGIRRSGRARKIRRWDGENYEVRLSKQPRRESAS